MVEGALFCEGELDATLRAHGAGLADKVNAIAQDQFMNAPEGEVVEHVLSQMQVTPLELHEDLARMSQSESKMDVSQWPGRNYFRDPGPIYLPSVEVTVTIPYTGDRQLWLLRPNRYQSLYPHGRPVHNRLPGGGTLAIQMVQPADEAPEKFKAELDRELATIRFFLDAQQAQIERFNSGLEAQTRSAVRARRERIEKHTGLASLLGIPLRHRDGAPEVAPIPMKRRLVRPLPPVPRAGYTPEPGITDQDYDHVLSVIRHEGRTFEATPATYAVHDEEELRNILMAHLNGHYQGDATGETFRGKGKTDIRIEDDNRAAFVAECKVWRGPKQLSEAVYQLLGYLTWRDCKTAIVIFNKHNARFSGILDAIPKVFEEHQSYRTTHSTSQAGEWQFSMTLLEDSARIVRVHVFAFNLYAP